ncbi:MAG: XRE family transcriptional regulator [Planctomycetes bacterium]|nr:XRE family transcriptional regulator [Planctomycetota bacterium]
MTKHPKTSSATKILDRITGKRPEIRQAIEEHKLNSQIAEMILAARERASLTQTQLAKMVGTTQSAISRLEDADYEGHSLTMLQKVAEALDQRVEVRFVAVTSGSPRRRKTSRRTAATK